MSFINSMAVFSAAMSANVAAQAANLVVQNTRADKPHREGRIFATTGYEKCQACGRSVEVAYSGDRGGNSSPRPLRTRCPECGDIARDPDGATMTVEVLGPNDIYEFQ